MVSREFILAGDAIFTIEIPPAFRAKLGCQVHYTYRVQKVEASDRWPDAWFAKLLVGPDNTSDYRYVGKLDDFAGQVNTTAKSYLPADAMPLVLLNRILARVWCDDHGAYEAHGFATHHEGRCGRCGRTLTTPASCARGIGPECAEKMAMA